MRSSSPTSASRGTLSRIKVCSVSKLAIIKGSVAFFAPEIGIVPLSGRPPTIRIRSILTPRCRSRTIQDRPDRDLIRTIFIYAPGAAKAQSGMPDLTDRSLVSASIASELGRWCFGPFWRGFFARLAIECQIATSSLLLAALEVFAKSRRQPFAARRPFFRFAALAHDSSFKARHLPHRKPQVRLRHLARYGKDRRLFLCFPASICRVWAGLGRCRSSVVEHPLGKGEVLSSILSGSTRPPAINRAMTSEFPCRRCSRWTSLPPPHKQFALSCPRRRLTLGRCSPKVPASRSW